MRFRIENGVLVQQEASPAGVPDLIVALLPQAKTQAKVVPWSTINHSQAGGGKTSWRNLQSWWQNPAAKGTEAHTVTELDGGVVQFMPFNVRADCNFKANGWVADGKYVGAISDESQDFGGASLSATPWSAQQLETKAQVHAALHVAYGIPLEVCPGPFARGVGFHSQYAPWSAYVGKTCPGAARIAQMPELIARARQIVDEALNPSKPVVVVPPVDVPSTPAGGDLMITVFQPTDCLAEFIGMTDKNGNALEVEWINTAAAQARRDAHIAAGARVDRGGCTKGRFRNCKLSGPIPYGDTYSWSEADFFRVVP